MNAPTRSSKSSAATWIAAALVVLPFLQALSFDFDRSGAVVLLLPALWVGRVNLAQSLAQLSAGPLWLKFAALLSALGLLASLVTADQFAPALVTAASWTLIAATGLVAGQCVAEDATAGRRLLAGLALGAAAGGLAVWALWFLSGRGTVPLYAHHRLLGLHALLGAVASLALIVNRDVYRAGRYFWLATGVVTWAGMLWTGGRAPMVALAATVVIWMLLSHGTQRREIFRNSSLLLVAGLALSAVFWTSNPELGWWHAIGRTASGAASGSVSQLSSTRTDFWREVVHRAKLSPWVGHGPDSYRFLTPKLDGQQPHNFVLQFWLDLGVVGAVPLLVLLAGVLIIGWKRAVALELEMPLAWLAVLTAGVVAGLLDGVFYHLLALLPVMLAFGVALGLVSNPAPPARISQAPKWILGTATAVSLLHMGIFYVVAVAPPPPPTSWVTDSVRYFPSSTFGLWRWLDDWQASYPNETLEWARWAQLHSPNPIFFHVYAARLLASQGNRGAAERELQAAWDEAHWSVRPSIEAMIRQLHPPAP